MNKTYSSFEEYQSLTEGWRRYLKEDVEPSNKDIQALADEMQKMQKAFAAIKEKYPEEYEKAVVDPLKTEENLLKEIGLPVLPPVISFFIGSFPNWWDLVKQSLVNVSQTKAVGETKPEFGKMLATAAMRMTKYEQRANSFFKWFGQQLEKGLREFEAYADLDEGEYQVVVRAVRWVGRQIKRWYTSEVGQFIHDPTGTSLAKTGMVISLVSTITIDVVYYAYKEFGEEDIPPEQFKRYLKDIQKIKQKAAPAPERTLEDPPDLETMKPKPPPPRSPRATPEETDAALQRVLHRLKSKKAKARKKRIGPREKAALAESIHSETLNRWHKLAGINARVI